MLPGGHIDDWTGGKAAGSWETGHGATFIVGRASQVVVAESLRLQSCERQRRACC